MSRFTKLNLLKVIIATAITTNIYANDIFEQQKIEKEKKQKIINAILNSDSKEVISYKFALNNKKLSYNENGNIIMHMNKDYMNIDKSMIFNHLKFDTTLDRQSIFSCELNNENNSIYCDHPFYTADSADELGGGLLSIGKSLFDGKVAVEKKFDNYEFSKAIMDNEDFIKQFVEKKVYALIKDSENQVLETQIAEQNNSLTKITKEREIENLKSEIEKVKMEKHLRVQENKINTLKKELLKQKQSQEVLKKETVNKELVTKQNNEIKKLKEELLKQKQSQEVLKKETVNKELVIKQNNEIKKIKEELLKQKQNQKLLKSEINNGKKEQLNFEKLKNVGSDNSEKLKKELEQQKVQKKEIEKLKKELEQQKVQKKEIEKLKKELEEQKALNNESKNINVKQEEFLKQKKELEILKSEIEQKKKEQESLKKEIMNL